MTMTSHLLPMDPSPRYLFMARRDMAAAVNKAPNPNAQYAGTTRRGERSRVCGMPSGIFTQAIPRASPPGKTYKECQRRRGRHGACRRNKTCYNRKNPRIERRKHTKQDNREAGCTASYGKREDYRARCSVAVELGQPVARKAAKPCRTVEIPRDPMACVEEYPVLLLPKQVRRICALVEYGEKGAVYRQ